MKINFQFLLCQHPFGSIIHYNIQCITELIIFLLNPRLNSKTKDYYGYRLKKLKYLNIIATMTRSRLKHLSRCKPTLSYTKLKKNAQNNVMIYIFQFDTTLSPAPKNFGRVVPRQMNILKPNSRSMLCASYSEKRSFDA